MKWLIGIVYALVIGAILFIFWKIYEKFTTLYDSAGDAISAAGQAAADTIVKYSPYVNPASSENLAYKGISGLSDATGIGNGTGSLGSTGYDYVDTVAGWFGAGDEKADSSTITGRNGGGERSSATYETDQEYYARIQQEQIEQGALFGFGA